MLIGNRIRKIDIEKYLPIAKDNLGSKFFTTKEFCKVTKISKSSAWRILKASKDQKLITVMKGRRIICNGRFRGQEPDLYKLNISRIKSFI